MWIAPFWGTFGASRGQQAEQGGASRGSAGSILELSLQVTGSCKEKGPQGALTFPITMVEPTKGLDTDVEAFS